MTYTNILVENLENTCLITINRADKLNALNIDTLREIRQAVLAANEDSGVRAILLTGAGQKAFAAGADIAEFAGFSIEEGTRMSADGHEVMNTIERSGKPVIALVNGFALGGGCELAIACHVRIASENARFGQPEINLGLIPGYAGTQRLCQLIGKGRAVEMLISGEAVTAEQALAMGLCTKVVPVDQLLETGLEYAGKLARKSTSAVYAILSSVNAHYDKTQDGFQKEIHEFGARFGTGDFKEGTTAFLEKREARFPGN